MSRRLRLEDRKVLQNKAEEEEEEDKLKLQKQRIFAPIVWARMGCGVKIQDLKEDVYQEVLDEITTFFIRDDVLFKNAEMASDELSIKSLLERFLFILKDTTSLIAINEPTNEIAGFLMMKVVHKADYGQIFSRTIMNSGVAMKKCLAIETALNRKVDVFSLYNCDSFLQIFSVVIKPHCRKKGIGYEMMKCAFDVARLLKQSVVMGIFDNCSLQIKARKLGMEILNEISYVEWRDKNGEMIFDDPGAGNYSVALMAGVVSEAEEPEAASLPPEETEEKKKEQVTRAEKRADKPQNKKRK